jgi:hypothetical protein
MVVQFGRIQILAHRQSPTAEEYERRSEAIRRSIRGEVEVLGPDPEVYEAIQQQLGAYPRKAIIAESEQIQQRFEAHVKGLVAENQQNPDYRALLFHIHANGTLAPGGEVFELKLLVDGEDVPALTRQVFERGLFVPPVWGQPPAKYYVDKGRIADGLSNALSTVVQETYQKTLAAHQAGQPDQVLRLDA